MTTQEALALLDTAIADDVPSKVNPSMTRAQAVEIMRAAVLAGSLEGHLRPHVRLLREKNIRRAVADGKKPPTAAAAWEECRTAILTNVQSGDERLCGCNLTEGHLGDCYWYIMDKLAAVIRSIPNPYKTSHETH